MKAKVLYANKTSRNTGILDEATEKYIYASWMLKRKRKGVQMCSLRASHVANIYISLAKEEGRIASEGGLNFNSKTRP